METNMNELKTGGAGSDGTIHDLKDYEVVSDKKIIDSKTFIPMQLKTLQEGEIQKEINKLKKDFDFMVIPEHSERIWYIVKCLAGLASEKSFTLGLMKGVELVEGVVKRNIDIENWSHSVGSHSDDRGGDSDIECTCREKEVKYKQEALNSILSNITKIKQELK